MNFAICVLMLTVAVAECPPQAPPVDPRFNTTITPTVPLANITSLTVSADSSCQCGPDCSCGGTATSAPVQAKEGTGSHLFVGSQTSGPGVYLLADSSLCARGNCPQATKSKTTVKTTTSSSSGACGSFESYEEVTTYSEKPKKGGFFKRLFGGKKSKGGCARCG